MFSIKSPEYLFNKFENKVTQMFPAFPENVTQRQVSHVQDLWINGPTSQLFQAMIKKKLCYRSDPQQEHYLEDWKGQHLYSFSIHEKVDFKYCLDGAL